ncbi:MAG: aminotransferase class I/II-fold pyridoxal phosphate-dependent enzyme, partial [Betaproteobacteria bacterium]|nr:aminotransferase class I/II-fold pyridoxal phosphate-dependent enzyme [Betaproteobacteria bacterium]
MSAENSSVPFLDLAAINARHIDELGKAAVSTVATGRLVLGGQVASFEGEFASLCQAKYCIGVASGLDALILLLRAHIECGRLKRGSKVIVPANTYIATVLAISHCGLEPLPVEPCQATFNLDLQGVRQAAEGSSDVAAVMVVHLYGQKAPMQQLAALCRERNWLLLADAAQAAGISPEVTDGAAFSFYPSKNLGALGDGGAVVVDDEDVAETVRALRNYGSRQKYLNDYIGVNSRLDEIQAAMLRVKLPQLAADNEKRQQIAEQYCAQIDNPKVILPRLPETRDDHVWHLFV